MANFIKRLYYREDADADTDRDADNKLNGIAYRYNVLQIIELKPRKHKNQATVLALSEHAHAKQLVFFIRF